MSNCEPKQKWTGDLPYLRRSDGGALSPACSSFTLLSGLDGVIRNRSAALLETHRNLRSTLPNPGRTTPSNPPPTPPSPSTQPHIPRAPTNPTAPFMLAVRHPGMPHRHPSC